MATENKELFAALAAFQAELTTVGKDAVNPYFESKYVSLTSLMKTVLPALAKHGLMLTQWPDVTNLGEPALTTILLHPASGEGFERTTPLSLVKKDPQAQGSAITYMRRYAIASILQIVIDEDDDGNKASAVTVVNNITNVTVEKEIEEKDRINKKALDILLAEIKNSLDIQQKSQLKAWLKEEGLSLTSKWNVKEQDLEKIYKKISELKEPIGE